jgi:hypothetical protein
MTTVERELLANQFAIAELAELAADRHPDNGWTAGQVCAHLILNNGLFVETARAVERGEPGSYDNEATVGDDVTAALVAAAGSTRAIAGWLRTSAHAYLAVLDTLPTEVLDAMVTTTIHHERGLLVDAEPRRLGDLMVGELTFHAGVHLEQVRGLTQP